MFVHGAAEDGRVWEPQLAALADEFTVVAWDEPGAGRSSDALADFGLADYANCLAALIKALALGRAHVAGLSWGGTVVQELYRQHPGLVATLILVDTYAGWKGSLPEAEVAVRLEGGQIQPLSGSNNEEIRILKEKHKALWKFSVLIDRGVWDRAHRVKAAAVEYVGI